MYDIAITSLICMIIMVMSIQRRSVERLELRFVVILISDIAWRSRRASLTFMVMTMKVITRLMAMHQTSIEINTGENPPLLLNASNNSINNSVSTV